MLPDIEMLVPRNHSDYRIPFPHSTVVYIPRLAPFLYCLTGGRRDDNA